MKIDKDTCWYSPSECAKKMNEFFDKHRNDMEVQKHLFTFVKLLEHVDEKGVKLMDLGCGTALLSEFCKDFKYYGADLPHMIANCAWRNYPQYYYKPCDIIQDDLSWIKNEGYEVVVMNAIIDVMQHPLQVLERILCNCTKYVIIHRQEITEKGQTSVAKKGSYNSFTYHSIINRTQFTDMVDHCGYTIVKELSPGFGDWENGGSSFLLRKKKSWALHDIDIKLDAILNHKREGFYIEAGANDGVTQSNTMFFEYYRNWRGILIEPIKEIFDKCVASRSPKNVFINAALVGNEKKEHADFAWAKESSGLLGVINEGDVTKQLDKMRHEAITKERVHCITLNNILSRLPGTKIDLLILDLEGYEINVIKSIDFKKYNIEHILVEELEGDDELGNYLDTQGYGRIERITDHDFLYRKRGI